MRKTNSRCREKLSVVWSKTKKPFNDLSQYLNNTRTLSGKSVWLALFYPFVTRHTCGERTSKCDEWLYLQLIQKLDVLDKRYLKFDISLHKKIVDVFNELDSKKCYKQLWQTSKYSWTSLVLDGLEKLHWIQFNIVLNIYEAIFNVIARNML